MLSIQSLITRPRVAEGMREKEKTLAQLTRQLREMEGSREALLGEFHSQERALQETIRRLQEEMFRDPLLMEA